METVPPKVQERGVREVIAYFKDGTAPRALDLISPGTLCVLALVVDDAATPERELASALGAVTRGGVVHGVVEVV